MVFSSPVFLFVFLPLTMLLYYIFPGVTRNYILLALSLLFYAWGEPRLVFLMLISIVVNYVLALLVEKAKKCPVKLTLTLIAVALDLGFLFYYKYLNFFVDIIMKATGILLTETTVSLPIGISFYTFQIMSYVIDVYRGGVKAQKNPFYLGLYISLFPQLIAGPIVRYTDVEEQIRNRTLSTDKFYAGALRFMKGFAKKVLIADQLAPLVDKVFDQPNDSMLLKWIAMIAYTLQIYYDFSGYSDMAIGLGRIFGFDFVENFNFPYISKSVKEFWRRWHISLSSWFRDYVYIPLGGSRKGTFRTYCNLIIVFLLTGFWHGASWNFIFWGLFYAVFLVAERLGLSRFLEKLPVWLQHFYAVLVAALGWVMFRAADMGTALVYYKGLVTWGPEEVNRVIANMNPQYWMTIGLGMLFAVPHKKTGERLIGLKYGGALRATAMILLFLLAICFMTGAGFSPFLYFRF
ncbi:MAG: MBOAT family protein [Lachnospiraceae bacterium]|nr:MBOAT family protein [Lachnospiraceae bacterium]